MGWRHLQTSNCCGLSHRAAWGRIGAVLEKQPLGIHARKHEDKEDSMMTVGLTGLQQNPNSLPSRSGAECRNTHFLFLLLVA